MLLDALLAAKDRLLITYSGHDERTNARKPPAVPVGQLLDIVERTTTAGRDSVIVEHPLQPFDPRNFEGTPPWSFDAVTLQGAKALTTGLKTPPQPFLAGPLPAPDKQVLELDELIAFVSHPVRAFLRQRLGISLRDFSEEISDAIPIELDNLEKWEIGDRLLRARLDGTPLETALSAELARGGLPPGELTGRTLEFAARDVEQLVDAAADGERSSLDVRLTLPDGRTLSGTVPDLIGDTLQPVMYSRLGPRHRLTTWVRLLALSAARPDRAFAACTIGRSQRKGKIVDAAKIAPLGAETANNSAREPHRPLRPRHARARAAGLCDLRRLCAGGQRRQRPRDRRRACVDDAAERLRQGGPRARAPARPRRRHLDGAAAQRSALRRVVRAPLA